MSGMKKRIVALAAMAAVLLVLTCAVLYETVEADHDCTGADCSVCHPIAVCQGALRDLSLAAVAVAWAAAAADALCGAVPPGGRPIGTATLVTLKVKLTD